MSPHQLEPGKRWIEDKFRKIAKELGVPLGKMKWSPVEDSNMLSSLTYEVSGRLMVKKYPRGELEYVATQRSTQVRIVNQIKRLLMPRP